jgi:aromatic-L-amino-acid/L-tryptophan decarboxylase
LLAPVSLSAVCFRYRGSDEISEPDLNSVNTAILRKVIDRGRVYLSSTLLRDKFCLRACIVNHRTKVSDIDSVIPEVLAAASETR